MYLLFRCDCGRVNYSKKGFKTRKCVCGKNLKVKERRIIGEAQDHQEASKMVRKLQEEIHGGAIFTTADKF
ncbi:MAG TPA: DUF1922 domain-containing protein [Methanobacteriaceae archaeon]|nr:DUF1922 domain-containing protein [Methanobacteriaceae archaeon]